MTGLFAMIKSILSLALPIYRVYSAYLDLTYFDLFFSHNTIHSISQVLFILPSEQTLAGLQFKQAIAVV
jgi:hypothetical protein